MRPARRPSGNARRYSAGEATATAPASATAAAPASASAPISKGPVAWLRMLHQLKTEHQFLGRYSVDKLEAFHHYQANARWWRVTFVLLATPLPTLLVLLAMDAVPMADPRLGPHKNVVCFVRTVLSHGLMTAMCLLPARQALRLHDSGSYSVWKIALIALLTCVALESVFIPLAFAWRFPVPFRELLGVPVWCTLVVLLHYWLAPRVFTRRPRRTRVYLVVVTTQITILYGFLALSLAFAHVPTAAQVAMIACFPIVKVAIKRFVWKYARQLDDISTDVTICMVEISGSLYQTVCLQFAATKVIGVIILFTDLAQALSEVHAYLATEYLVDGRTSLSTAMAIVQSSVFPGADERPSVVHYSSTTSVASMAEPHSMSRRYSENGSVGAALGIQLRQRKPQAGSVFMQPKLVKKRASKRLMDLGRIDFDLLDLVSPRDGVELQQPPNEVDDPTTEIDERSTNEPAALAPSPPLSPPPCFPPHPLPLGDDPTTIARKSAPGVGVVLVGTEGVILNDEPGVSRPLKMPQAQAQSSTAFLRVASRTALHTDLSKGSGPPLPLLQPGRPHLGKPIGAAAATLANPPALVRKSTSSVPQTSSPGPATGSAIEWALGIPKRLLLQRKLSDNSTRPEPAQASPQQPSPPSPPRRASVSNSLSRVLPTQTAPPVAPPPTAPAPSISRHSSMPSPQQVTARPSLPFVGRTPSFDNRRRSIDPGFCNSSAVTIDGVQIARREQARILEQTLQLLFSCEVLVFVEYMEVVMPVLYAACVGTEWALPNGKYNLITLGLSHSAVVAAVGGSGLYACLEMLSLLILNYVVWRKYGVSAAHLLAFVLETYALTLQGKLVGAFIVISNTATLHQGVDFTFRFDYDTLLRPRAT